MKLIKWTILIAVILGAFFVYRFMKPEPPAPVVIAAPVLKGVGALGKIEPRSRVINISHNAGAEGVQIARLLIDEGQEVQKGEIIAVLSDHELRKAELEEVIKNTQALQARLTVEKVGHDYALKALQRARTLIKSNALSRSEFEQVEQVYKEKQGSIIDIEAQIESAKARETLFAERLQNMVIMSPITGTILKVRKREGERLDAEGVAEIADLSMLDVVAEVYEDDIASVKIGQKAVVTVAYDGKDYSGTVRELGYLVQGNDLNDTDPLADRDNRVVTVRITLDEKAIQELQHQIFRQVNVSILP